MYLTEMLDARVIWPSQSPWCNMVVVICKRDASLRMCVDFRRLNAITVKDSYLLPQILETLDTLVGAAWFSGLDQLWGYWQFLLSPESIPMTSFTLGNLGFYEFLRMPLPLCNAPTIFQQLMKNCLGELNFTYCLIYLYDIVVFSKNVEDHIK